MALNGPENLFKDRHYSLQAAISLITANYIIFALAVQICINCARIHWFFWIILALLAWYNYYTIRRNRDEFAEKRTQIIFGVSLVGMVVLYYLLGVVALHCDLVKPL